MYDCGHAATCMLFAVKPTASATQSWSSSWLQRRSRLPILSMPRVKQVCLLVFIIVNRVSVSYMDDQTK